MRHLRAPLSAKKCFSRRSSIRRRDIADFRLPLDVAYEGQTGDVALFQATAHFFRSRSAEDPLAPDPAKSSTDEEATYMAGLSSIQDIDLTPLPGKTYFD